MAHKHESKILHFCVIILCVSLIEIKSTEITLSDISDSIIKSLTNCDEKNDTLSVCLKKRCLLILDKYTRSADAINLMNSSLALVRNGDDNDNRIEIDEGDKSNRSDRSLTTFPLIRERLDNGLPVPEGPRQEMINALLISSVAKFLQTRSLQIKLPQFLMHLVRAGLTEGRGKKADKYYGALVMGGLLVAGSLIPVKLGALALLSGKALMTSVLALTLAGIVALKKLSSDSKPQQTTYEVINVPAGGHGGGHGHHARSLPLSTLPPDVIDPSLLPRLVKHRGEGPYRMYNSHYNYSETGDANSESDYLM